MVEYVRMAAGLATATGAAWAEARPQAAPFPARHDEP